MKWGSLDSFLVQDAFWQDKMGKPIANKDFLLALLSYGSFEAYKFYYLDAEDLDSGRARLAEWLPAEQFARVQFATQATLADDLGDGGIDVLHQGDFTYHAPYLMEYRNQNGGGNSGDGEFAVSGVTHSLDGIKIQTRLMQILMAGPRPWDRIICTSECAKTMLQNAFAVTRERFHARFAAELPTAPELTQIPLGLADVFDTPLDRAACRRALEVPDDHLLLLSLGRFSIRRKMDLAPMLECLQHLIAGDKLPPLTMVLAGSGTDSEVALAADLVDRLGLGEQVRIEANHTFERKRTLYGAADLFVSLADNYQETFGLTIIEAMAHGLPTVVADFNGYKELVADGETGFRVPTYASAAEEPWQALAGLLDPAMLGFYRSQKVAFDFTRFADALGTLAANRELRREMGEAGRARSRAYRWSSIVPRYEALWREQREQVLAARGAGPKARNATPLPPMLVFDHARVFGHYPSRRLERDSEVRVSAYCRDRVAEDFKPVIYETLAPHLSFKVMQEIMSRLGDSALALGALADTVSRIRGIGHGAMMLNFDFLLKHGYIELAPEA